MYLKYGVTTVDINELYIKPQALDGNTEAHKSLTGKTIAVYETGPQIRRWQLSGQMPESKRVALKALWELVDGPEKALIFRDLSGGDHNVKWIDETFPIKRATFGLAEGTITLEEI